MRGRLKIATSILYMNPRNPFGQQIVMSLQVTGRRSDVHPIGSLGNVREERFTLLEQPGKQTILERMIFATRDEIQDLRLEHISAGVDVLARGNFRLWLFQEAADATIVFCFDYAVGARVFNWSQDNGRDS